MVDFTGHYYDLIIIGGGINGAGIARDAAGRGLKVLLCEQGDFAQETSSKSSKLIHGGLRYLEYYDFRLVREALKERDVLLSNAPHLVWPLRFVLPVAPDGRPKWLLRLGLYLYDWLYRSSSLPKSGGHALSKSSFGKILSKKFKSALEYSDCWVQDSRLVLANMSAAAEEGAVILPYCKCVGADRGTEKDGWSVTLERQYPWDDEKRTETVKGRVIINASGPWVQELNETIFHSNPGKSVRLVQGSHIILPKFVKSEDACLLQAPDGRVVFVLPYEGKFNLVGTTDVPVESHQKRGQIQAEEIDYLLEVLRENFDLEFDKEEIVHSFSGVRPLFDDMQGNPSAVTRDYVFDLDRGEDHRQAGILSIFGGKITTYRKLSEHALEQLAEILPIDLRGWTEHSPLPGGTIYEDDFDDFTKVVYQKFSKLPVGLLDHYLTHYGTKLFQILPKKCGSVEQLGTHFGAHFYEAEARYLIRREWSCSADSILWNRTKWGLHLTEEEIQSFRDWFNEKEKVLKRSTALKF